MSVKSFDLKVDGLKLAGQIYVPGDVKASSYPMVIICHGIPSGITNPGDPGYPILAEKISHLGFLVATFNFRGCGMSSGNFDILGWTVDLEFIIDYLWTLPEVDRNRLVLLGFSGGAAVSIFVAARDKRVTALVSGACPAGFAALSDANNLKAGLEYFRGIGIIRDKDFPPHPERWLSGFKQVNPLENIARMAPRPLLLVHGSQDEVVNVDDARRLFNRAREPKRLVIIDGAGHQLRLNEQAMAEVIGWLETLASPH